MTFQLQFFLFFVTKKSCSFFALTYIVLKNQLKRGIILMKKMKTIILLLILTLNLTTSLSTTTEIAPCYADPSIGLVDEVTGQ